MEKRLANIIRAVLILMIAASAIMCIFWLPNAVSYVENYQTLNGAKGALYAVCYAVAAPLFAVFGLAFKFPEAIKNDTVFSKPTARLLKIISVIIFADCLALGAGAIWLFSVGERVLSPALGFVSFIGLLVALMLFVLHGYVINATELKEEADATL